MPSLCDSIRRLFWRTLGCAVFLVILAPATASAQSVTLAWDANTDGITQGYIVQYGTASGAWSVSTDVGSVTQFTVNGLTKGLSYYFVVRAYGGDGLQSMPSTEVAATIPYLPAISPTDPGLELMFTDAQGALISARFTGFTQAGLNETLPVKPSDPAWKVVGLADFNGDRRRDILWQHSVTGWMAVWIMNGTTLVDGQVLSPQNPGDPAWKVIAVADFNGDGHNDVLFRHAGTRAMAVWLMRGITLVDGSLLSPVIVDDPRWRVIGAGDLDADRKADIVFQHADGTVAAWLMNGATLRDGAIINPSKVADPAWKLIAVSDADGDGRADLVWRHDITTSIAIWMMNGFNLRDGAILKMLATDPTWVFSGAR